MVGWLVGCGNSPAVAVEVVVASFSTVEGGFGSRGLDFERKDNDSIN